MKLELPEQKKLVHETTFPIRWGDMDAMGHVNNTVYFRYMETARIDWLRSLGGEPDARGEGVVIINAFCNFHRQLEYPGEVLLKSYVSDPGRSSYESWMTMEKPGEPGVFYATGGATTVWVDFPRQRSAPLPAWLRRVLTD
ncbi:MAG: acyl-CoA thioesterase [Proteobacteria bacterium]|jgi:acyl-CoA thioester hydrolase|nr:acyl-CoA thioesterase [Pseudomonadota bacterium]